MSRHLSHIFELSAVLTAVTPLHVGNSDDALVQDAPLALDGAGNPYLPATSLAGPLRDWWRKSFSDDKRQEPTRVGGKDGKPIAAQDGLWGQAEGRNAGDESGFASLFIIDDAPAILQTGAAPELRDGVGIDRFTGAAAPAIKFDRQILPAGTTFGLRIQLEVPSVKIEHAPHLNFEEAKARFAALAVALENGAIRFGGGKTRGLGRLAASGITITAHDLATRTGILKRLAGTGNPEPWAELKQAAFATAPIETVTIQIDWTAVTPVYSQAGMSGITIDALPLTSAKGAGARSLVLPGSAIKGALRSQAERICRTLARTFEEPATKHLKTIAIPLVETLFGAPGRSDKDAAGEPAKTCMGRGALGIDDCFFGPDISTGNWNDLVREHHADDKIKVAMAQEKIDAIGWKQPTDNRDGGAYLSQHVAIDRWTGGAAEGFLYNRLEPPKGSGMFRLTLDGGRLVTDDKGTRGAHAKQAAIALLLFVLRDLVRGRISIGFGGTRGLGSISITAIHVEGDTLGFAAGALALGADMPKALQDKMATFGAADQAWKSYWAFDDAPMEQGAQSS
jgi:CRISPR/Cas system CSM-associated protein Csm3 (group 7 of RAMP superfamily)